MGLGLSYNPLEILYPNGRVMGVQMFVWDINTLSPVLWDGALNAGTIDIGIVDQGSPGLSPWLVTGPLTNAQLRASAVPVSGTFFQVTQPISAVSLPLPTGAATEATLLTRTKPADQQHVIVDSSSSIVVTGPLTDTQLRATPVPITGSVTANAGTNLNTSTLNLETTQALVKAKTDNLDVLLSTRLKPADTLAKVTTVDTITNPVAVTGAFFPATQPVSGTVTDIAISTSRSDTYVAPANGVAITATANPFKAYAIQVVGQGTLASIWDVRLEGSLDGVNFDQILQHTNTTGDGKVVFSGSLIAPALYFRSRCAGLTLGTATGIVVTIVGIQ